MTKLKMRTGWARPALLLMPSLALIAACGTDTPEQAGQALKPSVELAFDVPQGKAAQVVHVVTRDIPAGAEIPWHTHPGVEIAYVESGDLELMVAGKDTVRLAPGGHFEVPRGTVHSGRNVGTTLARLVLTYVVDKDAPLRQPADAPGENNDAS